MLNVGNVVYPGFDMMTVSALSVFEYVNNHLEQQHYDVRLVSEFGGPIRSSLGIMVQTEAFDVTAFDTIIVGGNSDMAFTPGLLRYLEQAAVHCRRVAAKCAGAFFLAESGLLDGRRATTHWFFADDFKSRYPRVRLEENRLFVIDGPFWTSAGMTANIDLVLAMVEKDFGLHVANAVSRNLVLSNRRHGGQPQLSALLELGPTSDRIQTALAFARANLHLPLTVEQLAEAASLSPRQFSRAFREETGTSPAKAVEKLRIEAAQLLVQDGRHPIEVVARQTGFGESERMRRAFLRAFGRPPQAVRRDARVAVERASDGLPRVLVEQDT
jgi:transcriptional regulator GlxA family with amidase domain